MWTPLLSALLTAAPAAIQPWGLTLEVRGDAIVVTAVEAGSPAELAEVKPDTQLARILQPAPKRRLAIGALSHESLDDVVATLRETPAEQLVLELVRSGTREQKVIERAPFKPKTPEELRALPPRELGAYYFNLQRSRAQQRRPQRLGVRFEFERGDPVAIVDPKTHRLTGVLVGGATGEWLWVQGQLTYSCPTSRAVSATIQGAERVVVDLVSSRLHGGSQRLLVPAFRLADVEKCPAAPLVRELDLELKCEQDEPVAGRDKLQLVVECSGVTREDFAPSPFTRLEPAVFETQVREGTATVTVRPHFDRGGPLPTSVTILVNDKAGKPAATLAKAWQPDPVTGVEQLADAKLPVPRAVGKYTVVYEASWADGSRSRSSGTPLEVLSAAADARSKSEFAEGSRAMIGVGEKMKAAGINPCDRKAAIPWLRKQPEVESVFESNSSDYSYLVKKFPAPMIVHCD